MNIAILGATGRAGSRLLDEAIRRGHAITAISHSSPLSTWPGVRVAQVDANQVEQLAAVLSGHDVVISAMKFHKVSAQALIDGVRSAGVPRLLVVGGAGSLLLEDGSQLLDSPNFPAASLEEAKAGRDLLEQLKLTTDLNWSFLSPSMIFTPGERTGSFRIGKDYLLFDEAGKSTVSMEDFAIAMLDEAEHALHSRQRFTVGY